MLWPKWKRRSLIFKSGTLRTFRNCWRTQTHVWVKWRANTWPRPSPQWVFFSFLSICGNWPLTLHVAVLCWHAQWISECDAGLEEISLPPDSVQTSVPRGGGLPKELWDFALRCSVPPLFNPPLTSTNLSCLLPGFQSRENFLFLFVMFHSL